MNLLTMQYQYSKKDLKTPTHFFVLLKNYPAIFFIRLFPVIIIYQFFWLLFVIKKGQVAAYLQGMGHALLSIRRIRNKRNELSRYDRLTPQEFASCLRAAEKTVVDSIIHRRSAEGKSNWLLRIYCFFAVKIS